MRSERSRPGWSSSERSRSGWLTSDVGRSVAASLIAAVLGIAIYRSVLAAYAVRGTAALVTQLVVVWAVFALVHALLTWIAYRGLAGADLRAAIGASTSGPAGWRRLVRGDTGPGWAVWLSAVALLAVGVIVVVPALQATAVVVAASAVLVLACWLDSIVSYATHYARLDAAGDMLDIPGGHPPCFEDYLYFAVSAQTTFGTTDVTVIHPAMRKALTGHALLAFFFNTVLVAVVLSLAVSAGG